MTRSLVAITAVLALLLACGESSPVIADGLPGLYEASEFTLTEGETTEDLLTRGASITLNLNPDGSTTGRLLLPAGDEDGSEVDADLTGTWTLTGSEVSFDHAADTFLRDMSFVVDVEGRLAGEETFSDGITLRLVLQRQ